MKKSLMLILLFLFSIFNFGQKLNFDSIKRNVQDPDSQYYYEKLILKFRNSPSKMDSAKITNLYYGKHYSKNNLTKVNTDYFKSADYFKKGRHKQAKLYGEEYLKKDPIHCEVIWMVKNGYRNDKKSKEYILYSAQEKDLTDLIFKSGDGKTIETPYLINSVGEEYFIMLLLNEYLYKFNRKSYVQKDGISDELTKGRKKYFLKVLYNMEEQK